MKQINDFHTLVILAFWNKNVFVPEWVSKYIFPGIPLHFEINIGAQSIYKFTANSIRMEVMSERMNFVSLETNQDHYEKLEEIAWSLTDYFPHTPPQAFGINFGFKDIPCSFFDEIFRFSDQEKIINMGLKFQDLNVRRRFKYDGDKDLSIFYTKTENDVHLEFNYNFPIKSMREIKEKYLRGLHYELYEYSLRFLDETYKLKIE
jgi:hypothetical protein